MKHFNRIFLSLDSKQVNTSKMHLFLSDEVLIDGVKETQNQSEKQLRLV